MQLSLQNSKKRILNRETKIELLLEVAVNEYGTTELSFFRFDKRICRFKLKQISAADLLTTENGFHCIARAAVKAFHKVQVCVNLQMLSQAHGHDQCLEYTPSSLVTSNKYILKPANINPNRSYTG